MYKYQYVVSGGTFDQLHAGHKAFLRAQFRFSKHVLIGVTSDTYIKRYKSQHPIASFASRVEKVKEFLTQEHVLERAKIAAIDDVYIPTPWEQYPIEAIVVTDDTRHGAEQINKIRREKALAPLAIVSIPSVADKEKKIISSTRIREGEIDSDGATLVLPVAFRKELQKPFGQLFSDVDEWIRKNTTPELKIVSIGDEVTEALLQRHFGQKVAVVDLLVNRQKRYAAVSDHALRGDERILSVVNQPGHITPELFAAAKTSLFSQGRYIVFVEGEEDLAVLPFILLAPIGFQILYGQPHEGIVAIPVTKECKQKAKNIVDRFTVLASK